ncbi:MAG TPA: hypothetical protein VGF59_24030 [Bryobacteraceae bacterium]|jgi:hypothetical protein
MLRYVCLFFVLLLLTATAADPDVAGKYTGEWKSNGSGAGGDFRMTLQSADAGGWKFEAVFTLSGEEVKTKTQEIKVTGSKIEAAYDFDLQGVTLRSRLTGDWNGKGFEGKYQTTSVDGSAAVDAGTWTVHK